MIELAHAENHVHVVSSFNALVSTPFQGEMNAICWMRNLQGDFSEIVNLLFFNGNMTEVDQEELNELELSEAGKLARETLLNDLKALKDLGASPVLNLIKHYERDDSFPFLPTDVYSFHVDRSPIPTDTFLCTYFGAPSEIVANSQVTQKVLIPEIRQELKKLYNDSKDFTEDNTVDGFESFLIENFFDLHYQLKPSAIPISLGVGHMWRLAIDHPESKVPPSIHRAPIEKKGEIRLMIIC
jgi:hypothetical protein